MLRVLNLEAGAQVALSVGELDARIEQWVRAHTDGDVGESADAGARASKPSALYERPELATDYVEPQGDAERILADVWCRVLGIRRIGANDSFFELGGDSLMGLDVVARAGREGLRITHSRQIFECPTIAELARDAGTTVRVSAEQGRVTGDVPLIPVQRWFFEQDVPNRQHFNLPMMVEIPRELDPRFVERALAEVIAHHDALRLRYETAGGEIRQFHDDGDAEFALESVGPYRHPRRRTRTRDGGARNRFASQPRSRDGSAASRSAI